MLPRIGNVGSIDLFSFNDIKPTPKAQDRMFPEPEPPIHVLTLHFPRLRPSRQLRSIGSHSAPYLGNPSAQAVPFYTSQNHRIHLLQLHYGDMTPQFNLFVKNEYLLDLIDQVHCQTGVYAMTQIGFLFDSNPDLALITPMPREKPRPKRWLGWEQWGPANTRFLKQNINFQWLR